MPSDSRVLPGRGVHGLLIAGSTAMLALVLAAPWAAHRGLWITPLLYAVFDPVCHQIGERSFQLWGEPLAVCHRCTGLYLGFALGIAIWPALPRTAERLLARPRAIVLFAIPLAIDAVVLAASNTAASRFATGLIAAFPVALFALAAAAQLARRFNGGPHANSGPTPEIEEARIARRRTGRTQASAPRAELDPHGARA